VWAIKLNWSEPVQRVLSVATSLCLLLTTLVILISFQSDNAMAISPPWGDDMEIGPGMWTTNSNGAGTEWEWGTPQNVGPNTTHSGLYAWGTNIDSNYSTGALAHLESPDFDLALSTNTRLEFWHYVDTQDFFVTHDWDGGLIEVSTDGGNSWVQIEDENKPNPDPYYDSALRDTRGNPLGGREAYCYDHLTWTQVSVDLSLFDGSPGFKFRFAFGTDLFGGDSPGWYIDDVIVSADLREGILVEPDHSVISIAGSAHTFDLTVRNLQALSETVDIQVSDDLGWPIDLLQSDGLSPLADTGGLPGIPDTGVLLPDASFDFVANVTIPAGTPFSTEDIVRVDGIPFFGSVASDSAYIKLSTPSPDVSVTSFAVPPFRVTGDSTTVTASITNLGRYPRSFDVRLDVYGPGQVVFNPINTIVNLLPDATENVSWMFTINVPGEYVLTVETLLPGDTVQENNVSTKVLKVMTIAFEDDMESGGPASQGQWTPDTGAQNAWELGIPLMAGPGACHSFTDCWGTNINTDYKKGADLRLGTPMIDLTKSDEAALRFWNFYDIYGPILNDGGFVEVSTDGGLSWVYIEPLEGYPGLLDLAAPTPPGGGAGVYAGTSPTWELAEFDLSSFVGKQIVIGFHLWTDSTNYQSGWDGWYIDDFQILHIPTGPVLIFTEIQDSGLSGEQIEIYNDGKESDNLNNYAISKDGGTTSINGAWSSPQINPGAYSVFSTTGNELGDDGEMLYLVNTTSGWLEDQTGYGQRGVVPDPIREESSARFWNGTDYEEYWTRSAVKSFGFPNSVPAWNDQPEVVLSEVYFNPQVAGEEFVEIYYTGNSSINLRGYTIVCDNAYIISIDIILNPLRNHYIYILAAFPGLFQEMTVTGENLYLYDSTGSYLDMVGWSSAHGIGESMARVPDGNGTHDGYEDLSSYQAGWRFGRGPTMALISLLPDQTGFGDLGDTVTYTLTILNQPLVDLISLTVNPSSQWQIDFLKEDWSPLTDTNSDSLLDTGSIPASSFFNFTVNITIPTQPPIGNEMVAEVYANSSLNKAKDIAILTTRVFPHLEPMKRADPEEIFLEGVGTNEVTEITLEVFGGGYVVVERRPEDTIFILDSSDSMDSSDPSNLRHEAAKKYVDNMTVPDRGAVVDFDGAATLVNNDHLSSDYVRIKQNIDTIDSRGATNIGLGLEVANAELTAFGNSSNLWIEILLTDGVEGTANYPFTSQRIQDAVDAGIIVFTIGLGPAVNDTLLTEIADRTGGKYFHAMTAEDLEEIYSRVGLLVYDIAGRDVNITDSIPMIRDVVRPYINIDYGSFSTFPDAIYTTVDGTVLEWNVSQIKVEESWKVTYRATSSQLGWVPVGVYPKARVVHVRWNNENATSPFPDTMIHVTLPPVGPPKNLRTSVENNVDIRLDWQSPIEPTISHYLIYRSGHQREFDFTDPIYNTSNDPSPTRTNWTDLGAADSNAPKEYYYSVRVVDSNFSASTTTNTAGKWTQSFVNGLNTFSLPLETFSNVNISQLVTDIPNTELIRWMGNDGRWVTHIAGMGQGINDQTAKVGRGYEISLSSDANYTFVGLPGAMISYHEGFGDPIPFRKGLVADVQGINIALSWQPLPGASAYEIHRSTWRDGLFDRSIPPINTVTATFNDYIDAGVALPGRQYYYWIVPIGPNGEKGSSSYSVGVYVESYRQGTDAFSLPLKLPVGVWTNEIVERDGTIVGVAYMIDGLWKFHAREMPPMVYDVTVEQGVGYQISTVGVATVVFIGY
jgi:hypothetical protein